MFVFANGHALDSQAELSGLAQSMFKDRATQFRDRLGWAVSVDPFTGQERDEYDQPDSTYVIIRDRKGQHAGSMRLRSTAKPVMINDHFRHLLPRTCAVISDRIWESTRFCLSPDLRDGRRVAARLMFAAANFALMRGIGSFVAVFDARMVPIYTRIGWPPKILGQGATGQAVSCSAGRWDFDAALFRRASRSAGLTSEDEAAMKGAIRRYDDLEQVVNEAFP